MWISYILTSLYECDKDLIIAIDGPAASGKSTTAKRVAERLGFLHMDTGAMYRAVTLKVLRLGIGLDDAERIGRVMDRTTVELSRSGGMLKVVLDGEDVTSAVRSVDVTQAVSAVSSLRIVRAAMVREQRRMAEEGNIVAEGRDIGTVVFPDADLKFFMIASIDARARRRQRELQEQGVEADLDELILTIAQRDAIDSTREESPLRKAPDAIEIDTSAMTIDQQVEVVVHKAQARLGGSRKHESHH